MDQTQKEADLQEQREAETDAICDELQKLVDTKPRTVFVERKIKSLMKRAGFPDKAKIMFRR